MSIEINKHLKEYVEAQDTIGAQTSIQGLISKDRRLKEFQTPIFVKYADENLSKFWNEDDGETEFPKKDKWDNELWKTMCIEMEYNFSKKKFDFIIEIMHYLRDSGHPDFQYMPKADKSSKINNESLQAKDEKDNSSIVKYAIIGGAIGLVGGAIISKTIVGGIIGTLVGGGAGYLKDKAK